MAVPSVAISATPVPSSYPILLKSAPPTTPLPHSQAPPATPIVVKSSPSAAEIVNEFTKIGKLDNFDGIIAEALCRARRLYHDTAAFDYGLLLAATLIG